MKRLLPIVFGLAALVSLPRTAAAQGTHSERSAKADLHVSHSIVVGTTTLTPGDYTFQCKDIDGQHYLVVTSNEGEEVTRVPCTPEALVKKAETTEFRSITRPDGTPQLTSLRIKGETIAHRVLTPTT